MHTSVKKGRSKYRAVRTQYNGRWYDSAKEARYARQLDMLRSAIDPAERVVEVEYQPVFELVPPPHRITYRADFRVKYGDGRVEIVDVKGYTTPVCKMKLKLMKAKYPELNVKLV
jgi:hypothetical protein